MKKYKIIKTYPGSDKLGTVITLNKNGECWSTPQVVIESDCKNNPEFFEEIIQKDYEVLSLKATDCQQFTFYLKKNGLYGTSTDTSELGSQTLESLLEYTWKINSIRRLSDNEVFSVGDKVDSTISDLGRATDITGFKVENDKLTVGLRNLGYYPLSTIVLPRPVILLTKDGVEIFERTSRLSGVLIDTLKLNIADLSYETIVRNYSLRDHYLFSSKEAAQEFILMNKPVLSIKDLVDLAKNCNTVLCISSAESQSYQSDFEKVKELVKSRL